MTRFTTHFGFQTTAAEVVAGVDLTGRKAIMRSIPKTPNGCGIYP